MTNWLYQISPKEWSPNRYRLEIWEGERWSWPVGSKSTGGKLPELGDIVIFFYSPTGGNDPGFYGWAVVLEWYQGSSAPLYFRPTTPSDHLKMHPWWNEEAATLANKIRGKVKQKTLWIINDDLAKEIRRGITKWLSISDQSIVQYSGTRLIRRCGQLGIPYQKIIESPYAKAHGWNNFKIQYKDGVNDTIEWGVKKRPIKENETTPHSYEEMMKLLGLRLTP